jgi:hypothetical protein
MSGGRTHYDVGLEKTVVNYVAISPTSSLHAARPFILP